MAIYSIRDLEKLTGIKAHTIRIWEQRYGLITPARTNTNIRYYTDDNLRLLFNIAILNRHGVKISKLAKMKPEDITAKGAEITQNKGSINSQIEALTLAMIDLDEADFEAVYSDFVHDHGFENSMIELIYPFLDKLQVLWLTSSIHPAQEKFIVNLIRNKLIGAIDRLPPVSAKSGMPTVLLFTAESELQELPLLFMQYLIKARRLRAVYIGNGVNTHDLKEICEVVRPEFVYTILQEPIPRQTVQGYIDQIAQSIAGGRLLLTGAQLFLGPIRLPSNTQVLNGLYETVQFLDDLQITGKS
ncbi:MAG: MerR family transcriptional regulator [Saprospiraceae bacterium]|nr:MerR family transcriptional regulator [Saprospiraceae bacterium]